MSTWPQCALRYDGTFAGFLTCVGESFRQKTYPFYFLPPGRSRSPSIPSRRSPRTPPWPGPSTGPWRLRCPLPSAG